MANFPQNALDDGELTVHELRRLLHEIVRERMRVVSDMHMAAYWAGREKARELKLVPDLPYNPSQLHELRDVLIDEVRQEMQIFMALELTTTKKD